MPACTHAYIHTYNHRCIYSDTQSLACAFARAAGKRGLSQEKPRKKGTESRHFVCKIVHRQCPVVSLVLFARWRVHWGRFREERGEDHFLQPCVLPVTATIGRRPFEDRNLGKQCCFVELFGRFFSSATGMSGRILRISRVQKRRVLPGFSQHARGAIEITSVTFAVFASGCTPRTLRHHTCWCHTLRRDRHFPYA